MNIRALATALVAASMACAMPAAAQDSPVVGTWETSAETPLGALSSTWTFVHAASGYAIEIVDAPMAPPPGVPAGGGPESAPPAMESTISDLKIDGAEFTFKRSLTTPRGPFALEYVGSVAGDTLTAKAKSDFGDIAITGTRK